MPRKRRSTWLWSLLATVGAFACLIWIAFPPSLAVVLTSVVILATVGYVLTGV